MAQRRFQFGAFALLSVLIAPVAAAGTETEPEISDPPGSPTGVLSSPAPPMYADAIDILATWIHGETADEFQITMKVVDLARHEDILQFPNSFVRYGTRFKTPWIDVDTAERPESWWNNTWIAQLYMTPRGAEAFLEIPGDPGFAKAGEEVTLNFTMDLAASTLTLVVPRSAIENPPAGAALIDLGSLHDFAVEYPSYHDGAGAHGRDYIFSLGPGGLKCCHVNRPRSQTRLRLSMRRHHEPPLPHRLRT